MSEKYIYSIMHGATIIKKKNMGVFGQILVSIPRSTNRSLSFGFSNLCLFRILFCPFCDIYLTHLILHDLIPRVISGELQNNTNSLYNNVLPNNQRKEI